MTQEKRNKKTLTRWFNASLGLGKNFDLGSERLSCRELNKKLRLDKANGFEELKVLRNKGDGGFDFLDLQINRAYENNKVMFAPTFTSASILIAIIGLLIKFFSQSATSQYVIFAVILLLLLALLLVAQKVTQYINESKTIIEECAFKLEKEESKDSTDQKSQMVDFAAIRQATDKVEAELIKVNTNIKNAKAELEEVKGDLAEVKGDLAEAKADLNKSN